MGLRDACASKKFFSDSPMQCTLYKHSAKATPTTVLSSLGSTWLPPGGRGIQRGGERGKNILHNLCWGWGRWGWGDMELVFVGTTVLFED